MHGMYRRFAVILTALAVLSALPAAMSAAPKTPPKPARPKRITRGQLHRLLLRRRRRAPKPYSKNHLSVRSAFKPVAARAAGATVAIYCKGKQVGLGAVVDADGYVLTKASELPPSPQCRLGDGRKLPATIVAKDDRNDVALLKVSAKGLKTVQWADDDNPPVGSWIVTPALGDVPVSVGVVSVRARKSPSVRRPSHGFLGVGWASRGSETRIGLVVPRTGAARAGLKPNDVITRINGQAVKNRGALLRVLGKTKPNQKIKLHIKRGDKELDVSATLGEYPPGGRINPQQLVGGDLSKRRTGFQRIIQHDSTLRPNQCGGPALDADGKTVGINIARAGRVETYILPASLARSIVAKLKAAAKTSSRSASRDGG